MSDAIQSDPADGLDFEAALAELETLVERMETGSMSLEESLKAFERGIKLTRTCQDALKNAELRVKALLADGSEVPLETLATDD
ncbi:MAG: exodeoxyribonuclease VII small subunit [Gammaproteobacteria bacterium]|nr:exodeoxyribonuclease VII small subunit [Gammaproteobacteria bacterium]